MNPTSTKAMRAIARKGKRITAFILWRRPSKGKSRIERHRMINSALAAELAGGVHALAIHAKAPGEGGI